MHRFRFFAVAAVLLLGFTMSGQETRDIDVTVRLQRDGSAIVTQKWDVTVVKGTEWYIPVNRAKPRYIHDLSVVENGIVYESDGRKWNSDRSLAEKTHRCGILEKSGGDIELCWGQGPYGDHLYEATFIIDNLVQAYDDYDGFNWQFLNDEWSVRPKHAKVTVLNESGHPADSGAVRGWGFGFEGELTIEGDKLVAESTEPFRYESSVILLMRFDKGIFEPQTSVEGSFSKLQERAFEGSDYGKSKKSMDEIIDDILGYIVMFFMFLFVPLLFVGYLLWLLWAKVTGNRYKKKIFGKTKITGWFREPPLGDNLTGTYSLLNEGDHFANKKELSNLIGAFFLKWIQEGLVRPERDAKNEKRVNLVFTQPESGADADMDDTMEKKVYTAAIEAAGSNYILEANEFKRWSERHYKQVANWPDTAKAAGRSGWAGRSQEERQRVVQFRNFLKDFTLVDQREVSEVGLWKTYLTYAQVFGVADKVADSLKKLFPAQFDDFVKQTYAFDYTSMNYILRDINRSSSSMMSAAFDKKAAADARAARASGGGGHTSFGGGGGFSGGGHGGGSR